MSDCFLNIRSIKFATSLQKLTRFQLPPPISGIDVIIHLSVPDKVAIKRACGRRKHKNGEEYHEVNRPPPEGSYTGVPPSYDEFNVKHRLVV